MNPLIEYWWVPLLIGAFLWSAAYIAYKFFAHPPVWYEDLPPKYFNEGDEE